jgi:hypothetical protein
MRRGASPTRYTRKPELPNVHGVESRTENPKKILNPNEKNIPKKNRKTWKKMRVQENKKKFRKSPKKNQVRENEKK